MHSDRRHVTAMLTAGAAGYLLKSAAAAELFLAIQAVTAGLPYVSPAVADVLQEQAATAEEETTARLTSRERQVLQLLAEGLTSREIGDRLDLRLPTVETYRRQIMDKLKLRSIAALTKYAVRNGLTSVER
jgi:DNA-binding NarL/FixJ family response regulator